MNLIGKEMGKKEFQENIRFYPRESVAMGLF
jgi:hypothetical protein